MDDDTINQQFQEVDDAIMNNRDNVPQILARLKSSIGNQSNEYSQLLHMKRISYFRATGNVNELRNEENRIEEKFSSLQQRRNPEPSQVRKREPIGHNILPDESIKADIQACLERFKPVRCNEEQKGFYKQLYSEITELIRLPVNSLDEYINIDLQYSRIKVSLDSLQIQILENSKETIGMANNLDLPVLTDLSFHLICLQYQLKVDFVNFVLSDKSKIRSILFADIPLSQEHTRIHCSKLSFLFHPKRCEPQQQMMFIEIFELIGDDLRKQSKELNNNRVDRVNLVEQHKLAGQEHLDKAYKNSDARNRTQNAVSAYRYYRAASKELETESNKGSILKQVELKRCMSLSLQLLEPNLTFETQIYAIVGIYLISKEGENHRCREDFKQFESILRSTNYSELRYSISTVGVTESTSHEFRLNKTITDFTRGSIKLEQFRDALSSDLRFTITNTPAFTDEQENQLGIKWIDTSSSIGIGISYLIGDIFFENNFYSRKQSSTTQNPKVHESINDILREALGYYTKRQYNDFLSCLTKRYFKNKILLGIKQECHGSTCIIILDVRPSVIVHELSRSSFSAEGIANFLILLGEVFLMAPKITPKDHLSPKVSVQVPKYADFIDCACKLFREVLNNSYLTERANSYDNRIVSQLSAQSESYIEDYQKTASSYIYPVSTVYIKERLIVSNSSDRLDYLRFVAQVNYAIALLIMGGKENLELSVKMIKGLKRGLRKTFQQEKMCTVTEIRLQALTDIFGVFGYTDHKPLDKNELDFLSQKFFRLASDVRIKRIDRILMNNEMVSYCEPITLDDDNQDEKDEFVLLDRVLGNVLRLNKKKFVENVCNNYNRSIEPLTSLMKEIIKKEKFPSINEWKESFLLGKYSLNFLYLPVLSFLYSIVFVPCTIRSHPDHGDIFVVTKEIIDKSKRSVKTSVYAVTEEMSDTESIQPVKAIFADSDVSLKYIYYQLELAKGGNVKADILNQIALYHRRQAEKIDKTHHLDALRKWDHAKKIYFEALSLNRNHLAALLGYATCLIMLNKYKKAEEVLKKDLEKRTYYRDSSERWFLLGLLKRKLHDYDEAIKSLKKALSLKNNYIDAQKELAFVEKLKNETIDKRMKIYKKMSLNHVERKFEQFNVLSIDGVGIRGLIPAVWMSELERRTNLVSSSMFHMMAGTSTGAIVAAGLALPDKFDKKRPRYKATDIVELYTNHSNRVFSRAPLISYWCGLGSKYTEEGRKSLFNEYFEDSRLSESLTDLIVTTVNSESNTTESFRRSFALEDSSKDYTFTDILMCTSAAPIYFPPYRLNDSVYVDGGLQAKNPAMHAYGYACRQTSNRDNIFVLSLGTGDYVPDPLKPNAERHLLFWLSNFFDVLKHVLDGPQSNIDRDLCNMLDSDKYQRWQVWLENPIVLDDIKKETLDNLMELAHVHFEEMDAFDNDNRLGKLIERLKGQ
ncbi:unnamed protein product [Rotaria socialis]|uniref:PNPLA domain-containing protein n=1 Tax=Rotaria socialis TaxID=392032 RepID=A0A818MKW5_9BILA|nr:unnamed protein product [Rotaria socialis]CAF4624213.1 unnamed protein product [Rotaria socialis]